MSRWWIVCVVGLLIASAVILPGSTEYMIGALSMLAAVGLVRFSQTSNSASNALRPFWNLIVGCVAVLFGPALVLPALAKLRDEGTMNGESVGALAIGSLITVAGLSLVAYGIGKNWRAERI